MRFSGTVTAGRTAMSASRRVRVNNELAMVSSIVISGCRPAAGSWQRYRAPPWLSFLGGERHKMPMAVPSRVWPSGAGRRADWDCRALWPPRSAPVKVPVSPRSAIPCGRRLLFHPRRLGRALRRRGRCLSTLRGRARAHLAPTRHLRMRLPRRRAIPPSFCATGLEIFLPSRGADAFMPLWLYTVDKAPPSKPSRA